MASRAVRTLAGLSVLVLSGCATVVHPEGYHHVTEVPATADVVHEKYQFSVIPPHKTLQDAPWRVFLDKKDPRSTLLYGGLPGHSYTLSILFRNSMAEIDRLARIAVAHHQNLHFQSSPFNPHCMSSNLMRLNGSGVPVRTLMAFCLSPQTLEVYEIVLTQRSRLAEEQDLPLLAEAMNTVMRSIKFK